MTNINLAKLHYSFQTKPLLIGGKAMEYYGLRKAKVRARCALDRQENISHPIWQGMLGLPPCSEIVY
jgi:hypothetical protein